MFRKLMAGHKMRAGLAAARRNRLDGAADRLREAAALAPDNPLANLHLAKTLAAKGDLEGAMPPLRRALELAGDSPAVNILAGAVFFDAGDFDSAERHFEAALKTNPRNDLARAYRALVRWRITGDRSYAEQLRKHGIPDSSDFAARLIMTVEEKARFQRKKHNETAGAASSTLASILSPDRDDDTPIFKKRVK